MSTFRPGEIIANRFDIDSVAGVGGMGTVYRAKDRLSEDWVALKVLHGVAANPLGGSRFAREAQILTELRHPGIVRHVAHGIAEHGDAYLAMEWLEGEDLRHRLQGGGLSLAESLSLIRQVATALTPVHQRGVIHRDLKPSNLFLRNSDVGRTILIDFGIARRGARSQAITGTGRVIGTPEYMAPEQARGEQGLTPAADIFSLGCILFECLTGAPPFVAETFAAVLAKILFDQPRRLMELRPDLPEAVSRLVHRMLAKEARERPADAPALLEDLDALTGLDAPAPVVSGRIKGAALTDSDQGLVCVLIARPPHTLDEIVDETQESLEVEAKHTLRRELRRAAERSGARVEIMVDGSMVATFTAVRGTATDLVTETVRTALMVREIWPEACLALATGRGILSGAIPTGEALDRAAQMLREGAEAPTPERVLLDEISAGLLDVRFRTRRTPSGTFELSSVELSADESRLLLGKPTPCVGREAELAVLDGSLKSCIEDSYARAVLVTAPPGMGKSRLRHEFLQRVMTRGEAVLVLIARGDPLATHSAYGLFGQAIRALCKVQDGEPLETRRQKLRQRAAAKVAAGEAAAVAELLGEMCGVPFRDEESAKLRAARQDPQLMSERVQAAALAFLRAECRAQPVLLVLEDLHWGDVPTVRLIDLALSELRDLPFLVLALARPEFNDQFPNLWAEHVQPLPLRPLGKKASERLATQTLGAAATPSVVARIVEQAGGNALYLEELIRAVAEGKKDELPGTVLAMLQARIGRLDPGARRALRAASAFGETFWLGGVCALLGIDGRRDEMDLHIETLTLAEIIEPHRSSRFAGERELHFRHAVMRDAAYALLSEEERRACHRLCLSYLEGVGELDSAVLSEHALRAGDSGRTLPYVIQAAQRAFDRCDVDAAERLAELGLRHGAEGEVRGEVLATLVWVHSTRQRYVHVFEAAAEALSLLPRDSARWLFVINQTIVTSLVTGRQDILLDMIRLHAAARPLPDATTQYVVTACVITAIYVIRGLRAPIREMIKACERAVDADPAGQNAARGFLMLSRSYLEYRLEPRPFTALESSQAAATILKEYGHRHYRLISGNQLALTMMHVGRHDEGAELLREMMSEAQRFHDPFYATMATLNLVSGLSEVGSREAAAQAVSLGRPIMTAAGAPAALLNAAMPYFAEALSRIGEHEEAERVAREAHVLLKATPIHHVMGYAALTRILLARGQAASARASAEEGLLLVQSFGGCGHMEMMLRLALTEARHAAGDVAAAHEALREAVAQLLLRADDAPDPASRARYLSAVEAHARLCALAGDWLGEPVI